MRLSQLNSILMKKITPAQKKIIIRGLIVVLVFLFFWLFIYSPTKNEVKKIKLELSGLENEIKQIEAMAGEPTIRGETIKSMQERLQELNNKFPAQEEEALRMLSDSAQKLNIELISIKPQPKKILLDQYGKEVKIAEKTCRIVFVSVKMKCRYEDLVKYIEILKQDLPGFVTVERLNIVKDKFGKTVKLNIRLDFNLYFLS